MQQANCKQFVNLWGKLYKKILIFSIKQHILVQIEYNKGIDEEEYILFGSRERRWLV